MRSVDSSLPSISGHWTRSQVRRIYLGVLPLALPLTQTLSSPPPLCHNTPTPINPLPPIHTHTHRRPPYRPFYHGQSKPGPCTPLPLPSPLLPNPRRPIRTTATNKPCRDQRRCRKAQSHPEQTRYALHYTVLCLSLSRPVCVQKFDKIVENLWNA